MFHYSVCMSIATVLFVFLGMSPGELALGQKRADKGFEISRTVSSGGQRL